MSSRKLSAKEHAKRVSVKELRRQVEALTIEHDKWRDAYHKMADGRFDSLRECRAREAELARQVETLTTERDSAKKMRDDVHQDFLDLMAANTALQAERDAWLARDKKATQSLVKLSDSLRAERTDNTALREALGRIVSPDYVLAAPAELRRIARAAVAAEMVAKTEVSVEQADLEQPPTATIEELRKENNEWWEAWQIHKRQVIDLTVSIVALREALERAHGSFVAIQQAEESWGREHLRDIAGRGMVDAAAALAAGSKGEA